MVVQVFLANLLDIVDTRLNETVKITYLSFYTETLKKSLTNNYYSHKRKL